MRRQTKQCCVGSRMLQVVPAVRPNSDHDHENAKRTARPHTRSTMLHDAISLTMANRAPHSLQRVQRHRARRRQLAPSINLIITHRVRHARHCAKTRRQRHGETCEPKRTYCNNNATKRKRRMVLCCKHTLCKKRLPWSMTRLLTKAQTIHHCAL